MKFTSVEKSQLFEITCHLSRYAMVYVSLEGSQLAHKEGVNSPETDLTRLSDIMLSLGTDSEISTKDLYFVAERWAAMGGSADTQKDLDNWAKQSLRKETQFEESVEATEFVEKLQEMLNDPRLANWCAATDTNFDKLSSHPLVAAQHAFAQVVRELDEAC